MGTSTGKEGREYFSSFRQHSLTFKYLEIDDFTRIDLLFNKKKADLRKRWLEQYDKESYINHNNSYIRYKDFFDKELMHYSVYANKRGIPNLMDGLKPGKRKILFTCFKTNINKEIKVN